MKVHIQETTLFHAPGSECEIVVRALWLTAQHNNSVARSRFIPQRVSPADGSLTAKDMYFVQVTPNG